MAISDLRHYLAEKLPDYMVPAEFVRMDALPLLPNGKINRHALPETTGERGEQSQAFEPPATAVEQLLARYWSELLQVERVGRHDNFFVLGGHSLLATRLISWIRKAFMVALPLRSLFEGPTVAELAQQLLKHETTPGQVEKIAALRQRIAKMSKDEIQARLKSNKKERGL